MTQGRAASSTRRWLRRVLIVSANLLLLGAIVGTIAATWLPAILDERQGERRERLERRWRR